MHAQAVGYNSIEAEDWEVATSGEEMSKMESLLLDKNRKMEHEVTQFKVQCLCFMAIYNSALVLHAPMNVAIWRYQYVGWTILERWCCIFFFLLVGGRK